jgi:anti-sigma factor RsiW
MSTLNDEDRANLTAYLDGELDEEATQALEAKLSQDPDARAELDELRQTWSMLDYLPRPSPSVTFTHRTMEKLSLERRPVQTGKMPSAHVGSWLAPLGWVALFALTAGMGWYASQRLFAPVPDPDEPIVRQLPVIEHWKEYQLVDDVDFLKALDQPDLFGEEAG